MSSRFSLAIAALATILVSSGLSADKEPDYPLGPDSNPQEGVPQGEIKGPFEWTSDIFPGTVREYWVYVPTARSPRASSFCRTGCGVRRDGRFLRCSTI